MLLAAMLMAAPGARADEFLPTRDENPLLRGFYRPLATDSRPAAGPIGAVTLSIMNTLEAERRGAEQLLVDGESDTLRLSFEDDAGLRSRYRITVPMLRDSGGFLDATIDAWHRFFGLPRGSRPYYPKNQLVYFYSGARQVYAHRAGSAVGDLSVDAGWYATDSAERTVSFWGGLKAPTGSASALKGSGAWDAAAWIHLAERWARWKLAAEAGIVQPSGDRIFGGLAHRASVFARGAVTRELGPEWSVRAQVDGQTSRVRDTGLRFLGPSAQLSLGALRRLAGRWQLALGFSEDAAVNTAPDITFFLGIHN